MTHDVKTTVARVELELSTQWGLHNPVLFTDAIVDFQKDYPASNYFHEVELGRCGFITFIANKRKGT